MRRVIELEMQPSPESNYTDLEFEWTAVDFQPTYMDIEVNFTKYPNVSIHTVADRLQVHFNGHWYFRARQDNEFVEQSVAVISKHVPPQMDPNSKFGSVSEFVSSATTAVIVIHFLLNLLLGTAIQQLLAAIRKLSIMLHLLIMNVTIPANAMVFFSSLFAFVSFDIVETEPFVRPLFRLYQDEVINENFY